MKIDTADLLERFCRYVRLETRSDAHSETTPSTPGQWDLLRLLERELREIGASEVEITEHGYVLATIPASTGCETAPTIAWFAHVDTATELPGGATPLVHRNWDGKPIVLPDDPTQVLSVENSPLLRGAIGQDLITASGKTLLGADDKAGVAIVMATARHLLRHPELKHGKIRLCFNPDEEIGRGVDKLDLERVGAVAAYTLDGESPGEIDWETFSADAATVTIRGVASHPGWAKDVMVNALRLAGRFVALLPMECSPERTAERDGFVHPTEISGNSERATVRLILRDFELDGLAAKRAVVERAAAELRATEPRAQVDVVFTEQYRNMRYWLEKDLRAVEVAQAAVRACGLEPKLRSVRGGTDGSKLTARGLLTPNIFTGMHEVHSQREWVTLQDMAQSATVLLKIAELWASGGAL